MIEEEPLSNDNQAAKQGLDDIRDSILTLAEFLGRTKNLPRDKYLGEVDLNFYEAREKLTGRGPVVSFKRPKVVEITGSQMRSQIEDGFRGFSGCHGGEELDQPAVESLKDSVLEGPPPAWMPTIDQLIKFDLDHETGRVAVKTGREEEIFHSAMESPAALVDDDAESEPDLSWLKSVWEKYMVPLLPETQSIDKPSDNEVRGLETQCRGCRFSFTTPVDLDHVDDEEYIQKSIPDAGNNGSVYSEISIEVPCTVQVRNVLQSSKVDGMGTCPSCGPGVMGSKYKGVPWCRRCGQQMEETFVWI